MEKVNNQQLKIVYECVPLECTVEKNAICRVNEAFDVLFDAVLNEMPKRDGVLSVPKSELDNSVRLGI